MTESLARVRVGLPPHLRTLAVTGSTVPEAEQVISYRVPEDGAPHFFEGRARRLLEAM